jgi:hypothetical protein
MRATQASFWARSWTMRRRRSALLLATAGSTRLNPPLANGRRCSRNASVIHRTPCVFPGRCPVAARPVLGRTQPYRSRPKVAVVPKDRSRSKSAGCRGRLFLPQVLDGPGWPWMARDRGRHPMTCDAEVLLETSSICIVDQDGSMVRKFNMSSDPEALAAAPIELDLVAGRAGGPDLLLGHRRPDHGRAGSSPSQSSVAARQSTPVREAAVFAQRLATAQGSWCGREVRGEGLRPAARTAA